jgi:hypothetical protein
MRYVSARHTLIRGYENTRILITKRVLPSIDRELIMKSDLGTSNCHSRPGHFHSETTVIDDLMTTLRRDQHEITGLLLGDINIARSCRKFFNRHCMGFQVQLLTQGLKILCHKWSCRTFSHKPKGRSAVFSITHKIVSKRGAEIFVARGECISYT